MPLLALSVFPLPGLPLVGAGADLAALIAAAARAADLEPQQGDIFAIAQEIVSKAEGRMVNLNSVEPSPESIELAKKTDKDPRLVHLILSESRRVVRSAPGVIITEHRLGIVLANAGIDRSNVDGGEDHVLLLPQDPDASASGLRQALQKLFGLRFGVMITDSVGRPWRLGTTGIAIGCSGIMALDDRRGQCDLFGRVLQVAEIATADSIAGAAALVMGEAAERVPVALVRGLDAGESSQNAATILRPAREDLFR